MGKQIEIGDPLEKDEHGMDQFARDAWSDFINQPFVPTTDGHGWEARAAAARADYIARKARPN